MRTDLFELYFKVIDDQKLTFEQKRKMLDEVRKVMSPEQNRWNFRYVIFPLALVALSVPAYFFVFLLTVKSTPPNVPEALLSLGATAVGALAGFLTHYTQPKDAAPTDSGAPRETPRSSSPAVDPTRSGETA